MHHFPSTELASVEIRPQRQGSETRIKSTTPGPFAWRATVKSINALDTSFRKPSLPSSLFPFCSSSQTSDRAYENNLLTLILLSAFFFKTLATAISKSSCPTYWRRSLRAYIPTLSVSTPHRSHWTLTSLCTDTPNFCSGAITHFLS